MRVAFGEPFDVPVGYLNTAVTGVPPQRVVTAVGEAVAAWSQGRVQPADLERVLQLQKTARLRLGKLLLQGGAVGVGVLAAAPLGAAGGFTSLRSSP